METQGCRAFRLRLVSCSVAVLLYFSLPRRADAEGRFDFKTLYYQESDDRMQIISPTVLYEQDLSPSLTIKLDGIYNSISGATPSGAPPLKTTTTYTTVATPGGGNATVTPSPRPGDEDEDEHEDDEDEDERRLNFGGRMASRYAAKAGATPVAPPKSSPTTTGGGGGGGSRVISNTSTAYDKNGKVPRAQVEDERIGANLELAKRMGRHTIAVQGAYSQESDYISRGIALRDSIDFNSKNSTFVLGGSYANDRVDAVSMVGPEDKDSVDLMAGVTQVLGKKTTGTLNVTVGMINGYLTDPYKIVELDGVLVPERRPDHKDKQVVFVALNRFVEDFNGAAEISCRYYTDDFGIQSYTGGLAWYQKIGKTLILRPAVRYYTQTEADFYGLRFTGDPEFYSSDYRVSEMAALGYGVKLIWQPNDRFSFDIAVDQYVQEGLDGVTADDMYPSALSVMTGVRIWL